MREMHIRRYDYLKQTLKPTEIYFEKLIVSGALKLYIGFITSMRTINRNYMKSQEGIHNLLPRVLMQ